MISLSFVQNTVFDKLMATVSDPSFFPAWWKSFGQPIYAQAQQTRWTTEGASEGFEWAQVTNPVAKAKRFADYFGSGTKTLIATSRLLASVLPPPFRGGAVSPEGIEAYQEVVSDSGVVVSSNAKSAYLPPKSGKTRKKRGGKYGFAYGKVVNEHRPFMVWGDDTRQNFADSFKSYLASSFKGNNQ